jgi:O-antigen ligase
MLEAWILRPPRWLLISAGLGVYAALIALTPTLPAALALAAPLLLLAICWWTLLGPNRWVGAFLCAATLLPPLPIPLGDSGPHPALLFAGVGLLAGVLRLGDWRIPAQNLTRSLLFFFFVLLLSVSLAAFYSGAAIAVGSLARVLLFGVSLYLFFYTAHGPWDGDPLPFARLLFWAGAASALFACLDFYFQFPAPAGFGPQFVWLASGVYRRAQGIFYEASTLGNFCAFFLVMVAVALVRPRDQIPVSRPALLAGGAIFSAALLFSYSRASVVNVVAAVAVLLWLDRARIRLRRPVVILLVAVAAGAAVSYAAFPAFVRIYWIRLWSSIVYFFEYTEGILSGRVANWQVLLRFLAENPWHAFFGIGYKTLPYSDFIGRPVIADNMYLSILAETGLAGLVAMLLFNFAILRAAYRARASFFGAWIFCFWTGQIFQMFSGDLLTYWRVLPIYFWVLAVAVRHAHSVPRSVQ